MRNIIFSGNLYLLLTLFLLGCLEKNEISNEKKLSNENKYLRWVGDIEHDSLTDIPNFKTCNGDENVLQYFNTGRGPVYAGEKPSLLRKFKAEYKAKFDKSQNGLIRIRFIVNCQGQAGRFRTLQSDFNYKEFEFDKNIVSNLNRITKNIENWEILYKGDKAVDYYFYLIFKIIDGQISEILP